MTKLLAACLVLGGFLAASAASAGTAIVDYQAEALQNGDTWETTAVSAGTQLEGNLGIRVNVRGERERRNLGVTERVLLTGSVKLTEKTALDVGLGAGSGAEYGPRGQQTVTLYSAIGPVEVYGGLGRTKYPTSTVHKAFADARVPVVPGWTLLVGATSSHSNDRAVGWAAKLGVEYAQGACTLFLTGYTGQEARDAARPVLGSLPNSSTAAGARCQIAPNVELSFKAIHTNADTLSRQGVFAGVTFSY